MRDGHIFHAVKLLLFSVVGLGWLSVREALSAPPVMDLAVLTYLAALSLANLLIALVLPAAEQFDGAAQAYFSQVFALCVLYCYSLAESTAAPAPLPCNGTLANTYRQAYFGGMTLHQAAAAVTVAYLAILLVLAAAPARYCSAEPRDWLARGTGHSILVLVAFHFGLFALRLPLPVLYTAMGGALVGVAVVAIVGMYPFDWEELLGVSLQTRLLGQAGVDMGVLSLLVCLSVVPAGILSGGVPWAMLLVGIVVLLAQAVYVWWDWEKAAPQLETPVPRLWRGVKLQ